MAKKLWMMGRAVLFVAIALVTILSGAWGALALWYKLPGGAVSRTLGSVVWVLVLIALAVFAISRRSWLPLGVYAVMYAALLSGGQALRRRTTACGRTMSPAC